MMPSKNYVYEIDASLAQNLPMGMTRKPIYYHPKHYHFQREPKPAMLQNYEISQKSTDEEENKLQIEAKPKRIRYLNPYRYYVTEDGFTFPTTTNENFAPLHLTNLSNKVSKIKIDKKTKEACYYLAPKFSNEDMVPWQYIVQKYKYGAGSSEYYDLAVAVEKFMLARQHWVSKLDEDPQTKVIFNSAESLPLSETVPQIAEVRLWREDVRSNFFVLKYVLNKPMQKLLGMSQENEVLMSLQTGIKSAELINKQDSIRTLEKYFLNYARLLQERFLSAKVDSPIMRIAKLCTDGTQLNINLTCRLIKYDGCVTWLYSYNVENEYKPVYHQSLYGQMYYPMMQPRPLDSYSKNSYPSIDEKLALQHTRESAIFFAKMFDYSKYVREDPPDHLVCKVRELIYDKPATKTEEVEVETDQTRTQLEVISQTLSATNETFN